MTGRGRNCFLKKYLITSYKDGKIATIYAKRVYLYDLIRRVIAQLILKTW